MKWEDNLKTSLENRTIKPSETSWDTLAARLDTADKRKPKVIYLWMGVAASVVAIIFSGSMLFKSNTPEIQKPVYVETEQQIEELIQPAEQLLEQEHLIKTAPTIQDLERFKNKSSNKEKLVKNSNNLTPTTQQNNSIAKNQKEEIVASLETTVQNQTLEDKKVLEIVAQINDLKSKGQTVTEADIDALLHQAQQEIAYQSILKEGTRIVDANALLQDVESDLQQSFRNKIFEALKSSYETVKTAVAERNN